MITINYDDRGCGAGKTLEALSVIAQQGGRHIYAVDRVNAIEERAAEFREKMQDRSFLIRTISAKSDRCYGQASVRLQVEAVPEEVGEHRDVLIFITHEGMKIADFSGFAEGGWSIWIDEVPSVLDNDRHRFELSWQTLARYYDLEKVEKGWSRIRARGRAREEKSGSEQADDAGKTFNIDEAKRTDEAKDVPDLAVLSRDDALGVLRPLHRRVLDPRREVFANLDAWSELAEKGREMGWYSLWSPHELAPFDAVFLLGNRLTRSATFQIWSTRWPGIVWQPMSVTCPAFAPRHAIITYFAHSHRASRGLFDSLEGRDHLRRIAAHLEHRTLRSNHIWTCNEPEKPIFSRLRGCFLSPAQAGSNSYSYADHVTMIYSVKPCSTMQGVYRRIGVDADWHMISAERETILQFVCRSCVRLSDDNRTIHINVYDREQAEYLREYFENSPLSYVVPDLRLENLGFAYHVRDSKGGRRRTVLTPEEREAKKAADKRKERDRGRRRREEKRRKEEASGLRTSPSRRGRKRASDRL